MMRHGTIVTTQSNSDKCQPCSGKPNWRSRSFRQAILAGARLKFLAEKRREKVFRLLKTVKKIADQRKRYFDPELLYVECGHCGAPVLWDEGKATDLLKQAGIDPHELDSSCILVTDGCPACGSKNEYSVRIFRITAESIDTMPPSHGHA